jgi:hypothetical protein
MDKLLNIIIIILLLVFAYLVINKYEKLNHIKNDLYEKENLDYIDDIFSKIKKNKKESISKNTENNKVDNNNNNTLIKPYFVDMRVHNDYRDTITAFNNIAPDQRPIFNRSVLPVKQVDVEPDQVKPLVKAFVENINESVKNDVSDYVIDKTGWDELAPENPGTTGWDKQQQKLGLPASIYNQPAERAKIKLLKIDKVDKFATAEQINFIVFMIIQKKNVSDQMIVKVSFVMNNSDINADRDFFKNKSASEISSQLDIKIEEISIVGFLTDHSYGDSTPREDFYKFNLQHNDVEKDDILDQEIILNELKKKYKQRQIESDGFNVLINPEQINNAAIFRLSSETPYKPIDSTN